MSEYKDDKTPSENPEKLPSEQEVSADQIPDNSEQLPEDTDSASTLTEDQILDDPEELDRQVEAQELETNKQQNDTSSLEDNVSPEDLEYMSDTSAAMLMKTPRGGRLLIYMMLLAIGCAITWASVAPLDEITRGLGKSFLPLTCRLSKTWRVALWKNSLYRKVS